MPRFLQRPLVEKWMSSSLVTGSCCARWIERRYRSSRRGGSWNSSERPVIRIRANQKIMAIRESVSTVRKLPGTRRSILPSRSSHFVAHWRGGSAIELSRNLLQAGTRIGLNLEEAAFATNRQAASIKIAGALQQALESRYWLRLLEQSDFAPEIDFRPYLTTVNELISLVSNVDGTTRAPSP